MNISDSLFVRHGFLENYIEDGYLSKQLSSDDLGEEVFKKNYERFNNELLCKEFKWKLGLEFASLKEFKEAILEYNVLNVRKIRFYFNDKKRARERCKHCTEYLVYVNKVGQTDTYRLNTI